MRAEREEGNIDYGTAMREAWESGLGDYDNDLETLEPIKFDDEGIPQLGEYVFGTLLVGFSLHAYCPTILTQSSTTNIFHYHRTSLL